ncbi:MAG: TMEM175 family protein [Methanoregula sp.]|nr:TMEM175 family protein [Methanoregula sp.]
MSEQETMDKYHISKSRLEALFDGIFAFAMTLLVTGFVVPPIPVSDAPAVLPGYIAAMRPEFYSFLIAFLILASFWLVHHRRFHYVRIVDPATGVDHPVHPCLYRDDAIYHKCQRGLFRRAGCR